MKNEQLMNYESPSVEVIEVEVESGFIGSIPSDGSLGEEGKKLAKMLSEFNEDVYSIIF